MSGRRAMLLVLAAWDLAWRAVAIRRAIRNRQYRWAVALLVVNSGGLFPMLYLSRWSHQRG